MALFEQLQQVEEHLCGIEQRTQERLRILELRVMQMERQSWRRSFGTASHTLPITPSSDPSLSSRSSSTGPLSTPKTQRGFDDGTFRSSSPDAFNPYWISPIMEEDSYVPGTFPWNLHAQGLHAFPQALIYSRPDPFYACKKFGSKFETSYIRKLDLDMDVHCSTADAQCPSHQYHETPTSPEASLESPHHDLRDILVHHSQDASVRLQLQLKRGSTERREIILDAMKPLMVPLATDQYGQYLVQRALSIQKEMSQYLCGAIVPLTLSPCGVHVIMRVLDGPEIWQNAVTKELLRDSLKTTLTTQHSMCVWQKIFNVRWSNTGMRSEIRDRIHDALRGQWADIANTETGSVLFQHLLANMMLSETDDAIEEVFQRFHECICHPWGVWVIQHLIEYGSPAIRECIAQRLISSAATVSLSSYGSKAVQCAQRHCGEVFQNKYADVLCRVTASHHETVRPKGPSRPLIIEVAAAQHGLPILTQLLTSTTPARRTLIIDLVRMNAVFLKSNRSGARAFQLCGAYGYVLHQSVHAPTPAIRHVKHLTAMIAVAVHDSGLYVRTIQSTTHFRGHVVA